MSTKQYLLSAWSWSPAVIGVCVAALLAYAVVLRFRFPARAGYFFAALAVLFLTLASPLNALADGYLFSAHMLQHMLLLLIVPPLLLLGMPTVQADAAIGWQRVRLPPLLGWVGGVGAMWLWHERTLCDLATRTETVRIIQIISFVVLGTLFWWPLHAPLARHRVAPLTGVVYLFSACLACSVLGILITFSPVGGVCPIFLQPPDQPALLGMIRNDWGITPAKDQQIGGLLMWIPGCAIYLTGVMAMLARWYGSAETDDPTATRAAKKDGRRLLPAHANAEDL